MSTLLQHLSRKQFEPSLCLFRDDITYPLPSDVEVSILDHRGPVSTWQSVKRLAETIDRIKPDLVISVMDYLGSFVGEALKSRKRSQSGLLEPATALVVTHKYCFARLSNQLSGWREVCCDSGVMGL